MSNHTKTIQKCKRILNHYDQIEPRRYCADPFTNSKEKKRYNQSFSSASKHSSQLKRDFSFCKSKSKISQSLHSNETSIKKRKQSNSSFVSTYCKESRFDKIMKLKVKPAYNQTKKVQKTKKSVLQNSFSSLRSSRSQNKQNKHSQNISRLEKIMKIKVVKPKVSSTLVYYEPIVGSKSIPKERKESAVKEWKQCQQRLKKSKQQQQKEDKLWRVFERERELRQRLKKQSEERDYKQKRRKQKRFESMVSKQISKIERQKQISKRKSEGFSHYVYPSY